MAGYLRRVAKSSRLATCHSQIYSLGLFPGPARVEDPIAFKSPAVSGHAGAKILSACGAGVSAPGVCLDRAHALAVLGGIRPFHHSQRSPRGAEGGTALASDHEEVPLVQVTPGPPGTDENLSGDALTPARVVELLDRYIVGQADAKRAVAVALRNRWRRHRVPSDMREEIVPKNILMIGPTGCGKTEIARRLAKLADAPFVKVEATKFTEVGFHGRDVDQIIRDLVDNAITLMRHKVQARVLKEVELAVENRLLEVLTGYGTAPDGEPAPANAKLDSMKNSFRELLRKGDLDSRTVHLEVPEGGRGRAPVGADGNFALNEILTKMEKVFKGQKAEKRDMTIGAARPLLVELELEKHLTNDNITKEAIELVESDGIVFIDEIDKIVTSSDSHHGADASSEGVQRDLLPIIEGSTVSTKYGNVSTDHILFICSGAFHSCRPSDMLAELQGRLPIRVELKGLTRQDLYRILTEPQSNMIRQQQLLMATEAIDLEFTDQAIHALAEVAAEVNKSLDNIGARRLHTVLERVVEDISFNAPERAGQHWVIDREDVMKAVGGLMHKTDLSKFVL